MPTNPPRRPTGQRGRSTVTTPTATPESVISGLTIEKTDPLPKSARGRSATPIPNPFLDAVWDSYKSGEPLAVQVPVTPKDFTYKTSERKGKDGEVVSEDRFQFHENVGTAIYFLRRAAAHHKIGVRIVVDYKENEQGAKDYIVKSGRVRIRFLGKPRRKYTKNAEQAA